MRLATVIAAGAFAHGALAVTCIAILMAYEDTWAEAAGPFLHPATMTVNGQLSHRALTLLERPLRWGVRAIPVNGALLAVAASWAFEWVRRLLTRTGRL